MKWRVIITDSEIDSGVAPVCPFQERVGELHDLIPDDPEPSTRFDTFGVYNCCPGPHLECWTPSNAQAVLMVLNVAEVEVCS